jgi:hypothetical protein
LLKPHRDWIPACAGMTSRSAMAMRVASTRDYSGQQWAKAGIQRLLEPPLQDAGFLFSHERRSFFEIPYSGGAVFCRRPGETDVWTSKRH